MIFPNHAFPTDEELGLKVGAQVMFVKNDPNTEKLFFNGKIGQVVRFGDDAIYVKCPDDAQEIAVTALEWNNTKYSLNETTKEVESDVLGTFTQYPLKLAWAITIHKSQGLTFERAIIDAEAAFAHGQVYVALSRCKSFEGIVLRSRISFSSIKTDVVVKNYNAEAERNAPDEKTLENSKREYQQKLMLELFDFENEQRAIGIFNRLLFENASAFQGGAFEQLNLIKEKAEAEIFGVAKKFQRQLLSFFNQTEMPENNEALQGRIKKASEYFYGKLSKEIRPMIKQVSILSDNQAALKKAFEKLNELRSAFYVKSTCLKNSLNGFSAASYVRSKANADIDFMAKTKREPTVLNAGLPTASPHPELFTRLNKWRNEWSKLEGIYAHEIVSMRSMLELTRHLPTTTKSLKKIHGVGEHKIKKYGGPILSLIERYIREFKIPTNQLDLTPIEKPTKKDTKLISFELLQGGKSIDEIAKERGFVRSTIEKHLGHYIKNGELDIFKLMKKEKVDEIIAFYEKEEERSSKLAKDFFGEKYTYGEIQMVLGWMEQEAK